MMMLAFYFIEKIKRFHLSREGKNKAEKNRSKVSEAFWKSIHAAKAEKAQVIILRAWLKIQMYFQRHMIS